MAEASRFILVKTHVHAQWDPLELVGKIEVDRCVVDGVGTQNDQQRDPTLLHVVVQFLERRRLLCGSMLDGLGEENGLADVSQIVVKRMGQKVDDRRLTFPGHDQAAAPMLFEILGYCRGPFFMRARSVSAGGDAEFRGNEAGKTFDFLRWKGEPMVRLRTRGGDSCFDDVQPVHSGLHRLSGRRAHATPGDEVGDPAQVPGTGREEILVEGQHHVGLSEVVVVVEILAEGQARPL